MSLEKDAIAAALARNDNNIEHAAEDLGASRRTLMKRMREYGYAPRKGGRRRQKLPYGRKRSAYGRKRNAWLAGGVVAAALIAGVVIVGKTST